MTPAGERPAFEGTPDGAKPRRRLRFTLGSILAFIAGMAVMLAVLLPFIPWASPRSPVMNPHTGMTGTQGAMSQSCASCHEIVPKGPALKGKGGGKGGVKTTSQLSLENGLHQEIGFRNPPGSFTR